MSRTELRNVKRGKETAAGSLKRELGELQRLQENNKAKDIMTITATCSDILTIICC